MQYLGLDDLCRLASRLCGREPSQTRNMLSCGLGERILMAPATVPSPLLPSHDVEYTARQNLAPRVVALMHRILLEHPLFEHNEDLAWVCGIEFADRNGYVFAPTAGSEDIAALVAAVRDGLSDASTQLVLTHLAPAQHAAGRHAA